MVEEEKPKILVMKEETRLMIIDFLKNRFNLRALQKLNNLDELQKFLNSLETKELQEIIDNCNIEINMRKLQEEEKKDE